MEGKTYLISIGDPDSAVTVCARIAGASEEEALDNFREKLEKDGSFWAMSSTPSLDRPMSAERGEYCCVYINNQALKDASVGEPAEWEEE